MPPSMRDRRQQDLVGPTPGQHLGRRGRRAARRGRSAGPARSYSPNEPVPVAPSDMLPTQQGDRDQPEQAKLLPARTRADRTRGRAAASAARGRAGGVRRHRERPLEPHPDLPDLQLVTEAHRRDAIDPATVDVRPVRAAEVLEVPAPAAIRQDRVLGRRERIVDDDRVVDVTAERRDDVEAERPTGERLPAGRLEDDQPARTVRRLAGRRPKVAQERADRPGPGRGRAGRGTAAGRPTGRAGSRPSVGRPGDLDDERRIPDLEPVADAEHDLVTSTPLTREPLVLPRSAKTSVPRRPAIRPWWRETRASRATRSLSVARPMVRLAAFDDDPAGPAIRVGHPEARPGAVVGLGTA